MAVHPSRIRFALINGFCDRSMRSLSHVDALVWITLWRHADRRNLARLAHSQIADAVGVHRTTVSRSIRRLIAAGLVRVHRRGGLRAGAAVYGIRGVAD